MLVDDPHHLPIRLLYPKVQWFSRSVSLPEWERPEISPSSHWYCIGSCFAERSARALKQHLLPVNFAAAAPLYTPIAIMHWLSLVFHSESQDYHTFSAEINRKTIQSETHYVFPFAPGCFKGKTREDLQKKIWQKCKEEFLFLSQSALNIVTFGSSFSFYSSEQDCYWSNGHRLQIRKSETEALAIKYPTSADFFLEKKLLTLAEIQHAIQEMISTLQKINHRAQIVCSISPLRHKNISAVDNSLSKAQLLSSLYHFCHKKAIYYLPAYEIIMDELRDYRWYDDQLTQLRPNSFSFILEQFLEKSASLSLRQYLESVLKIQKLTAHQHKDRKNPWLPEQKEKDENVQGESIQKKVEQALSELAQQYPRMHLPQNSKQYQEILASFAINPYHL